MKRTRRTTGVEEDEDREEHPVVVAAVAA